MSYTGKFLKSKGQDCIVLRNPPINTKVSIRRSTKASMNIGIREGFWEGLVLEDAVLKSGEFIKIRDITFLVQTTSYDPQSTETAFFAAKCNATIRHQRYADGVDENFNLIQEWQDVNPDMVYIPSYGEIVTYRMRQEDPGLLDGTKYTFQVPKSLGVLELDRISYNDKAYQVVSIDDVGLSGVYRVQLAQDTRPD